MLQIDLNLILNEIKRSISLFRPETMLVATFLISVIIDVVFKKSKNLVAFVAMAGFLITAYFLFDQSIGSQPTFFAMLAIDPFSQFFKFIILFTSFIIIVFSLSSRELQEQDRGLGEYYTFIVGMTFGMFLLTSASNLLMIYLSIETMSISSYILTGYTKEIKRSSEASLKYVIFGAVSSGIMLYGISIIYGLTGTLNLYGINSFLNHYQVSLIPLLLSSIMIIAGIGYKISAVPFHFWTPDVYEGAPVTITAFLSVASKAAGFAVLIRFIKVAFIDLSAPVQNEFWTMLKGVNWEVIIAVLSVLTMTVGNLIAVWQTNLKRLLAYSSIAHAGYIMMGLVILNNTGVTAMMIYFVVYLFMNLGAFYVVMLVANKIGSEDIEDYNGLGYRSPFLAVCLAIFLISLTGLPPTAGFIGKLYLFIALIQSKFIWLAVIAILNSVIALYYYVKVFRNMFIRNKEVNNNAIEYPLINKIVLLLFIIPTLVFGLYFTPIVSWAQASVKIFGLN
jgi:NADH-quinone oxidoreductase subunit N